MRCWRCCADVGLELQGAIVECCECRAHLGPLNQDSAHAWVRVPPLLVTSLVRNEDTTRPVLVSTTSTCPQQAYHIFFLI